MQEATMIKRTCHSSGLRRGTWTAEEDQLLRKCIEKHGEGKWHQVPPRAGLNRCRKSCRLRWLNYLKPNIKRGEFSVDEVDLILRLHKLLGNRWSLIAGRIPGRTANDVKNYWNTYLLKKLVKTAPTKMDGAQSNDKNSSAVIKPRPHTFISKNLLPVPNEKTDDKNIPSVEINNPIMNFKPPPDQAPENGSTTYTRDDQWSSESMFDKTRERIGGGSSSDEELQFMTGGSWIDQINFTGNEEAGTGFLQDGGQTDDIEDLAIDIDIWDILRF